MKRRQFIQVASLSTFGATIPTWLDSQVANAQIPSIVFLLCLGTIKNENFLWLDGRTQDGTVGLAPSASGGFYETGEGYTGTRWQVVTLDPNVPDVVSLECLGAIEGPRWLDGRTQDGTVGLAPSVEGYSGTRWQMIAADRSYSTYLFKCLEAIEGPRWLDGRTQDGTVGLAPSVEGYSGTRWAKYTPR